MLIWIKRLFDSILMWTIENVILDMRMDRELPISTTWEGKSMTGRAIGTLTRGTFDTKNSKTVIKIRKMPNELSLWAHIQNYSSKNILDKLSSRNTVMCTKPITDTVVRVTKTTLLETECFLYFTVKPVIEARLFAAVYLGSQWKH